MAKSFKETVRSMTGKKIVEAMIKGLQAKLYTVEMLTFGARRKDICVGCAATHCISNIAGIQFTTKNIGDRMTRAAILKTDYDFLARFENAIDELRRGEIHSYNETAKELRIATLPIPESRLPYLGTYTWETHLQAYIDYANTLT